MHSGESRNIALLALLPRVIPGYVLSVSIHSLPCKEVKQEQFPLMSISMNDLGPDEVDVRKFGPYNKRKKQQEKHVMLERKKETFLHFFGQQDRERLCGKH